MTRVAVILTTYQGVTRGYLAAAIASVLTQTYPHFHLYLVDDGSTDETRALCQAIDDPRVSYLFQLNQGPSAARNLGLRNSLEPLVSFIDDDDEWLPTKLAVQLEQMESSSQSIGMVYTGAQVVDARGGLIMDRPHQTGPDLMSEMHHRCIPALSSVMVRRSALETIGPFREDLRCCEDFELWLRLLRTYQIGSIPTPLIRQRLHGQQLTASLQNMETSRIGVLRTSLTLNPNLDSAAIYQSHYLLYAHQWLGRDEFGQYRRCIRSAHTFGLLPLVWYVRYLLTYCPPLLALARKLKDHLG